MDEVLERRLKNYKPLQDYFNKIPNEATRASVKEALTQCITRCHDLKTPEKLLEDHKEGAEVTLDDAIILLGHAHARLMLLEEVEVILQRVTYSNLPCVPRETVPLRDLHRKQVATAERLVKCLIFKKEKANEQETRADSGGAVPHQSPQ